MLTGLTAERLTVSWSGVVALDDVSLTVRPGQILGLIGPNGAGKTTLVNVLSGYVTPDRGTVTLDGRGITSLSPEKRVHAGVGRTFQDARLFRGLTVCENLTAAKLATRQHSRRAARRESELLLAEFRLEDLADKACESLSYGQQRRLSIARAVASEPTALLLDEPAAGLNDAETELLGEEIRDLPEKFGCGVMLIEHNIGLIASISHEVHVLDHGQTIYSGTPAEALRDSAVVAAYLGAGTAGKGGHDVAS